MFVLSPAASHADTTIFIVRHAEKLPTPADDPHLSPEGVARADALRDMLKEAGVSAVFASKFLRTQETAQPLATALGLDVRKDSMNDLASLAATLRGLPDDSAALVVGHSDTVGDLIKALGSNVSITIGPNEFDRLYIVTIGASRPTKVLKLHYKR